MTTTHSSNVGADASRGHTPGEWRCGDEDEGLDGVQYVEVYAGEYCTPSFRSIAHVEAAFDGDKWLPLDAETRANAALIAASPTMIDALIKAQPIVCKATCVGDDHSAECLHITATIAEATNA